MSRIDRRSITLALPALAVALLAPAGAAAASAQLQVCLQLTPTSQGLAGQPISFDVTTLAGRSTFTLTAPAPGQVKCGVLPQSVPAGAPVTIAQVPRQDARAAALRVSPSSSDDGSSGGTARLRPGSGLTTVTFDEQALGAVSVCKTVAGRPRSQQAFRFSIDGGAPFSVRAGLCSPTFWAPTGVATVSELPSDGPFTFRSVSATGGRLLSSPSSQPARVSVIYGGVANEVAVTFTNARVKQR